MKKNRGKAADDDEKQAEGGGEGGLGAQAHSAHPAISKGKLVERLAEVDRGGVGGDVIAVSSSVSASGIRSKVGLGM